MKYIFYIAFYRPNILYLRSILEMENLLLVYHHLYNNQINARALIGQSAVGYCAGKPAENSRVF